MIPRLHAVTDDRILERPDFERLAQEVLRIGGRRLALHVRGPGSTGRRIYDRARAVRPAARAAGATLLVNDRVDVARVLELDGVHLGQRSLPPAEARGILGSGATIGMSVHGDAEARAAERGGADYLVVGTIFRSRSHPDRSPAGTALLQSVGEVATIPRIAIGGIEPERAGEVLAADARGVAAVSAIWDAERPGEAVQAFLRVLERSE